MKHTPTCKLPFLKHGSAAIRSITGLLGAPIRASFVLWIAAAGAASAEVHRLNSDEMKMFQLVAKDLGQKRETPVLDPILCKVARERGADMARRNYFSHVNPSGQGPNLLVRRAGFLLPSYYDSSRPGNNIESIAMVIGDSKEAFALWMDSAPHKTHLLGEVGFYKEQTSIGVGVFRSPNAPYYRYYVFLSSPANASTKPPMLILKDPKGKIIARTRTNAAGLLNALENGL